MKISYSWLKDYIQLEQSPEEIAEILTQTGLEVGSIEEVETSKRRHERFGHRKGYYLRKPSQCR